MAAHMYPAPSGVLSVLSMNFSGLLVTTSAGSTSPRSFSAGLASRSEGKVRGASGWPCWRPSLEHAVVDKGSRRLHM